MERMKYTYCRSLVYWLSLFILLTFAGLSGAVPYEEDKLDCAMRNLFFRAAKTAVPWRKDMSDIFEALEIDSRCQNYTSDVRIGRKARENTSKHKLKRSYEGNFTTFYVCPNHGNDSLNSGNQSHPFLSLHRAIKETEAEVTSKSYPNKKRVIILREGIHYLESTIVLTPNHSNLLIKAAPNEDVWISGGKLIEARDISWTRTKKDSNIWVANVSSLDLPQITGLFTVTSHERMTLARYPNADVEEWDAKDRHIPRNDVKEWLFPPYDKVPEFFSIDLSIPDNPTGHIKNESTMPDYNRFGTGQGGACASVWGDQPSYWCSNVSAGGWAEVDKAASIAGRMNIPRGMILTNETTSDIFERAQHWNNPKGAVVHVSHTQGWAWHMFNISNQITGPDSITLHFDKGGSQGGRNWQCKDVDGHLSDCDGDDKRLCGGDWYIEGILEELDTPGEFYYDSVQSLLYFYPKDSFYGISPMTKNSTLRRKSVIIPDLIASNLQTLISIQGTMENPVKDVQLSGIGFRDGAKTYMEQWSAPSGGDWALHRGGALHLEGTEDIIISHSKFRRLDGNAIMLSGYCQGTHVTSSEFDWIGNGAIATWGDTVEFDATKPTQPRYSMIERNVMSNLGLYQKQSSGWGQNKACMNTIRNNVMFNLPRAAINFNDGLGGGNMVQGNVIFNACRESGDHGPINSWDRMPFLTNTSKKGPSFTPLPTHTTRNLILANYGASEGFDNDDGSSWYFTYNNLFYYADGFKMDYGGHDSKFFNNFVYAKGKHCFGTGSFLPGHADAFYNNTCMVIDSHGTQETNIGTLFQCSTEGMNPTNNMYYTPNGKAVWNCKPKPTPLTLKEMQQMGFEEGSSVETIPEVDVIISLALKILNGHP